MTLQDLLDELHQLPASAATARVEVRSDKPDDFDVISVRYEDGVVIIAVDEVELDGAEPDDE